MGLAFLSLLFLAEGGYVFWVFRNLSPYPVPDCDVVVVYGGEARRFPAALRLAQSLRKPLYMTGAPDEAAAARKQIPEGFNQATLDGTTLTTDQNARRAAAFIRSGGYKRAVLVTSWFHEPRALFLTRLYLWGTGVQVEPDPVSPVPSGWWREGLFWIETAKFWGSLGRVLLHSIGLGPPAREAGAVILLCQAPGPSSRIAP